MIELKNFSGLAGSVTDAYFNTSLTAVNDHVIKLSVLTEPYPWHIHPNSDETFIGVDGIVIIETKETVLELGPGMLVTIPANMPHCTRPKAERSVNMTVERADMETVIISPLPPGHF